MTIADLLPARIRKVVYTVLGAAVAVEAIVDVLPSVIEEKALAVAVVLGLVMARSNTTDITVVAA